MNRGVIISGIGHIGLILWAMLGGWLFAARDVPEIKVVDVQMISNAEFDAMMSAPPAVEPTPPEAAPQETSEEPQDPPPQPEPTPEPAPEVQPQPEPAVVPEPLPEPDLTLPEDPQPQPEPVPDPTAPPADVPQPIQVPRSQKPPRPRPADKITDTPPEEAPDTLNQADQAQAATTDSPTPEEPKPEEEAAKPEDTAPVLTPETEPVPDDAPALAPTASKRPQTRPKVADTPDPDQEAADKAAQLAQDQAAQDQADADKAAADQAAQDAADQAAIDAAIAAASEGSPDAPAGPPMTGGEIEGLRVAIKQCWNLGTLSSEAMQVVVTVRVDVGQDRRPVSTSIRMVDFTGANDAAANQVFEAARRAIIRCSKDGLPLPDDKYDSWKDLELVFDPTGMRLR